MFSRLWRFLWVLGGLAFALAAERPAALRPRPLLAVRERGSAWYEGGFQAGAIYSSTANGTLPKGAATLGSWVGSDDWRGKERTGWIPLGGSSVRVFVAGYPQNPACELRAEFRRADGAVSSQRCPLADPHETWKPWDLAIPPGTVSLRLVAVDGAMGPGGWLGFSEPFVGPPAFVAAAYPAAQIAATLALGLVLFWVPGLAAVCRLARAGRLNARVPGMRVASIAGMTPSAAPLAVGRMADPAVRAAVLIGSGPLVLAALGTLAWALGAWIPPVVTGEIGAFALWAAGGVAIWRRDWESAVDATAWKVIAIAALTAVAAVAKASYSGGPEGELFRGTVRRALDVGNRSDCEAPYRVVQVVNRHLSPFSPATEQYFTPWSFFSRGPLAGLASAPLVFAVAKPPAGEVDDAWQPFDPWGYAAYRAAMAVLAGTALVALFLVLTEFVGPAAAATGAAAMGLCPFVLHETMYTWPKLAATAGLTVSFHLAHRRRPLWSGAALALSYGFHPLALLWAPWIGLWAIGRANRSWAARAAAAVRFAGPVVLVVVPWMFAGEVCRRLSGSVMAGQSFFLSYFVAADGRAATFSSWLLSRWMNFANTYLPLWLHFFGESHADLNSVYGPAGPLVKFAFSWWNTLPLGMGLLFWTVAAAAAVRTARTAQSALWLLLVAPALLLTIYWGDAATGLMRECGHPLLPALIALAVMAMVRAPSAAATLFFHPVFPWLQLPEAAAMCWLTTLANPHPPSSSHAAFNPLWFAVNLLSLAAMAAIGSSLRSGSRPVKWSGR